MLKTHIRTLNLTAILITEFVFVLYGGVLSGSSVESWKIHISRGNRLPRSRTGR